MIIDTIADSVIGVIKYNNYHLRDDKKGWMGLLFAWRHLGGFIDNAIVALAKNDWKAFKKSMMDYMENLGYKECNYYNQFKRLSPKKISECIIDDGVDMSEMWYISEVEETPDGNRWIHHDYCKDENEAKLFLKLKSKRIIDAYNTTRGLNVEETHFADDHAWVSTKEGIQYKVDIRKWIVE
jgi:hypothetical protein